MNFHLNYKHPVQKIQFSHKDKLFLIGSCFAENIGKFLTDAKFNCLVNPNGILFNPLSIANALHNYLHPADFSENSITEADGLFHSFFHHGSFSSNNKNSLISSIHESNLKAHDQIKDSKFLIITFGTSQVFALKENGMIVANCHKLSQQLFVRKQLQPNEIINEYIRLIKDIRKLNPTLQIIFTVSPVKYLRDGLIENNLSKSVLIYSIHEILKSASNCFYFPAYELVTDDLRDYRFYKPDMAHPSEEAVEYIWKQFKHSYIDKVSLDLISEIEEIQKASTHKPIHPETQQHLNFKNTYLQKCRQLQSAHPQIDFSSEINSFS